MGQVQRGDLTGLRFGHLVVLSRDGFKVSPGGSKHALWKCRCDCGAKVSVLGTNLKNGNTRSCGKCGLVPKRCRVSDLAGQRFGYLTVIERTDDHITKGGHRLISWKCQCDCGRIVCVLATNLRNGISKSCGECGLTRGRGVLEDLTGQHFGYLTVIRRAENHVSKSGNSFVAWECQCDCGNIVIVTAGHLKTGHTRSCGKCGKFDCSIVLSRWEAWLAEFLDENHVSYEPQKSYDGLVGLGGGPLLYDFCLYVHEQDVLVECQGLQHYEPVDVFGGVDGFTKRVEHDRRKQEYAESHGIPLVALDCSDSNMNREQYMNLIQNCIGKYII